MLKKSSTCRVARRVGSSQQTPFSIANQAPQFRKGFLLLLPCRHLHIFGKRVSKKFALILVHTLEPLSAKLIHRLHRCCNQQEMREEKDKDRHLTTSAIPDSGQLLGSCNLKRAPGNLFDGFAIKASFVWGFFRQAVCVCLQLKYVESSIEKKYVLFLINKPRNLSK